MRKIIKVWDRGTITNGSGSLNYLVTVIWAFGIYKQPTHSKAHKFGVQYIPIFKLHNVIKESQ